MGTALTSRKNRPHGRERVHDQRKSGPGKKNDIAEQTDRAHPERTVADVVTAADEEADNGDGVRNVEKHNASRDHAKRGKEERLAT